MANFMSFVALLVLLFSITSAAPSFDPHCTTALIFYREWAYPSLNATLFGCGADGQRSIPCTTGLETSFTAKCINSGGGNQDIFSDNMQTLFFTRFTATIGFCFAQTLDTDAGGRVTVTLEYSIGNSNVVSQTASESVVLDKNSGACSHYIVVQPQFLDPDEVIKSFRITIDTENPTDVLDAVTVFDPEFCSDTRQYQEAGRLTNIYAGYNQTAPTPNIAIPPYPIAFEAGHLYCPLPTEDTGHTCFILRGNIEDATIFHRVPSFFLPRGYFQSGTDADGLIQRDVALRIEDSEIYVTESIDCFPDPNELLDSQLDISIGIAGYETLGFEIRTHWIERQQVPGSLFPGDGIYNTQFMYRRNFYRGTFSFMMTGVFFDDTLMVSEAKFLPIFSIFLLPTSMGGQSSYGSTVGWNFTLV